jgi:hypothetical protein
MMKIIIIKAQPKKKKKKKSWLDLECYERVERHEIWIDVGKSKSDVAAFGEDKKKSLSFTY